MENNHHAHRHTVHGFRDRWGNSRALANLVKVVESFDQFAPRSDHMALRLSLADGQRFVIFLMNHFRCFDLTITTSPLK